MNDKPYISDFIKVQQNLPKIGKHGKGNYGLYMKLEELMPQCLEVLNKNKFALLQMPTIVDGEPSLYTAIVHETGERIDTTMKLMLDKATAQGQGSAITYARRYALCAMLGLVADEDDDGQRADDEGIKRPVTKRPKDASAPLTPAQVGLVFARLKSKGISTKDEANNAIFLITGKDKISEVTMGEMDELLTGIDQLGTEELNIGSYKPEDTPF